MSAKRLEASKTTYHTEESSLESLAKATMARDRALTVIVNAENQLTSIDGGKGLTNANKSTGGEDRHNRFKMTAEWACFSAISDCLCQLYRINKREESHLFPLDKDIQ